MRKFRTHVVSSVILSILFSGLAMAQVDLREELKPLAPFVGKTWIGEFKNSTPENPVRDEVRYEVILNGQGVRSVHYVNGGYGGETIFMWDPSTHRIIFWYFTNAGMYSEGWIDLAEKSQMHRALNFNGGDITAWQASVVMHEDGTWSTEAHYFKNGAWVAGHAATYRLK